MATPFDRLMDTIRPHLPGSVDQAIRQELFTVCKTFFEDSNTWREDLPFTTTSTDETAEVLPYTGVINRLMYVKNSEGFPVYRVLLSDPINGVLQLPMTLGAGDYVATVALTVSDPVSRDAYPIVPQDLVTMYWQTLMYGILSQMMLQPKKPYSDPARAAYYATKFRSDTSRAINADKTGNAYGSQAWNYPQSFNATRSRR